MTDAESLEEITNAIHEAPFDLDLYLARALLWKDFKCYDEAASDLLFYEACGGNNPSYKKELGLVLYKSQSPRAMEYLQNYVRENPGDTQTIMLVADTFFELGNYEASAELYKKAVDAGIDRAILAEKAQYLTNKKMHDEAALFDSSFKKKGLFRR